MQLISYIFLTVKFSDNSNKNKTKYKSLNNSNPPEYANLLYPYPVHF